MRKIVASFVVAPPPIYVRLSCERERQSEKKKEENTQRLYTPEKTWRKKKRYIIEEKTRAKLDLIIHKRITFQVFRDYYFFSHPRSLS